MLLSYCAVLNRMTLLGSNISPAGYILKLKAIVFQCNKSGQGKGGVWNIRSYLNQLTKYPITRELSEFRESQFGDNSISISSDSERPRHLVTISITI